MQRQKKKNFSLLFCTIDIGHFDLASILLQLGAHVNIKYCSGMTPLLALVKRTKYNTKIFRLLLEWDGENESNLKEDCMKHAHQEALYKLASLLRSELEGRRCEIINMTTRVDLNDKACVADIYLPDTNQYKL